MSRPEFSHEELYLVSYYRSLETTHRRNSVARHLAALVPTVLVFSLGLYYADAVIAVIGFALYAFANVWSTFSNSRYGPVFASVVTKYEAALEAVADKPDGLGAPGS